MNTPEMLREQLAKLSDMQAALDALRTDILIQLKDAQPTNDSQLLSL